MSKYETYEDLLNDLKKDKEWGKFRQYAEIVLIILLLRDASELSQKDLASRSGVPLRIIKRFEDCKDIKLTDLIKIANVFNYKVTINKISDEEK